MTHSPVNVLDVKLGQTKMDSFERHGLGGFMTRDIIMRESKHARLTSSPWANRPNAMELARV